MKNIVTILLVLITILGSAQTATEKLMVMEINELRANPKSIIPNIEEYISLNTEMIDRIKSGKTKVSSSKLNGEAVIIDRINAAKELIEILNTIGPLDTLVFNADMYETTSIHASYLKETKRFSHNGPNGKTANERFKYTNLNVSENLSSVGNFNMTSTLPILITLLVDAGIDNRGHRNNLLNKDSKFISVSILKGICVQNFGY